MSQGPDATITIEVNGSPVEVVDQAATLLDVLRDQLGLRAAKDGCAPQGQCGCCTVLVDGQARVACVTPVRRVRGRSVTTVEAIDDAPAWADAFHACGATQCGFCTPGIIARFEALRRKQPDADRSAAAQALLAHLCRCTGWQTILDAWDLRASDAGGHGRSTDDADPDAAARRAELEGGRPQRISAATALGEGGFAADTAPPGAAVALRNAEGNWVCAPSMGAARVAAGAVQGRRTTAEARPPLAVPPSPDGRPWDLTLRTSWVEPAYLEPDASWAAPEVEPASPLANGGAFGGKSASAAVAAAVDQARAIGGPALAVYRREDVVRFGPKRPPIAAGLHADGSGVVRVVATPGIEDRIAMALPDVVVEAVELAGPPTSTDLRAAGWAEGTVLATAIGGLDDRGWTPPVTQPDGGAARARVGLGPTIEVEVWAGDPLDEVVLRSYCIGAAHQALSWVTSEALTVDDDGTPHDLTVRSFGVLRAVDTPTISVTVSGDRDVPPGPVSDAVFAAVAAAVWIRQGTPVDWPTGLLQSP